MLVYKIWIQYTNLFKSYGTETIFSKLKKGHNSQNNRWILLLIELDLYFMIIYPCTKFQSNIPILLKDIAWKPFFKVEKGHYSQNDWWILPFSEPDLHFMIIHLCIKFQSNTPVLSKDIARKPKVLCTGWTGRDRWARRTYVWTAVILYANHWKWRGNKNYLPDTHSCLDLWYSCKLVRNAVSKLYYDILTGFI